jgi:hypothetical protein
LTARTEEQLLICLTITMMASVILCSHGSDNEDSCLPRRDAVQSGRHAVRTYAPSIMGTRLRHQKSDVAVTSLLQSCQILFQHTSGIQDTMPRTLPLYDSCALFCILEFGVRFPGLPISSIVTMLPELHSLL